MNTDQDVKRDERTMAVENAAYKWAYSFLAWPLVVDALYRQKVRNGEVGDLIALICVSGAVGIVYLIIHKAWAPPRWPWRWSTTSLVLAGSFVAALLIGIVLSLL